MIPNDKRVAAEARALQLALAVAARVGWRFDRGPLPTTSFAQFLYVDAAQLLLVPTSAALPFATRQVEPVVREARSDALIVSSAGEGTPVFAMATWARSETVWTQPLLPWLADTSELWLVPDVDGATPFAFHLVDALHHVATVPWVLASERQAGLDRAAAWMREVVGG